MRVLRTRCGGLPLALNHRRRREGGSARGRSVEPLLELDGRAPWGCIVVAFRASLILGRFCFASLMAPTHTRIRASRSDATSEDEEKHAWIWKYEEHDMVFELESDVRLRVTRVLFQTPGGTSTSDSEMAKEGAEESPSFIGVSKLFAPMIVLVRMWTAYSYAVRVRCRGFSMSCFKEGLIGRRSEALAKVENRVLLLQQALLRDALLFVLFLSLFGVAPRGETSPPAPEVSRQCRVGFPSSHHRISDV